MEEEENDELAVVIALIYTATLGLILSMDTKPERRPRQYVIDQGRQKIDQILNSQHQARFEETFRMRKHVYLIILGSLEAAGLESSRILIDEKFLIFLQATAHGLHFRDIAEIHGKSLDTIHKCFRQVLAALLRIYPLMVKLPDGIECPQYIHSEPKLFPHLKDCIGALDGTHIRVKVGVRDQDVFRNRKGETTWNVLLACGFDQIVHYVLGGWEGSAHDSIVLQDGYRKGLNTPEDKFWLADGGYTNSSNILVPYQKVRYHLKEWGLAGLRPENYKELFNLRHAQARNVVERTFGTMKRRFRILRGDSQFSKEITLDILYAICVIHNFIVQFRQHDEDLDAGIEGEIGPEGTTNREQSNSMAGGMVSGGGSMDDFRDRIAQEMWRDYKQYFARKI